MSNTNTLPVPVPTSSINSFLEQSILIKGGTTCISSSSYKGINWTHLVIDMLISKMVRMDKYEDIIIICLDRNIIEIETFKQYFNEIMK